MTSRDQSLYRPRGLVDVLQVPFIGRILKSRWGRLTLQVPLLVIAVLLIIDGFTGPQLAARNLATVAPWVHYRGLVVLVLLLAGNLFCMGCPFTLPRTLAKRLSLRGRRFPKALRNKWVAIAGLFILFLLYEWLDLWASPLLTAWVIVGYFAASFVLEAVFTESAFCKYVCPLGTFNFVYSTTSPTQISVKNPAVCQSCVGKECINGSYATQPVIRVDEIAGGGTKEVRHGPEGTLGCGTLLFAPQIRSNLECTMCLDCVRACPHDNVGLMLRQPGRELRQPGAWPQRWDVSFLIILLAAMGLTNAFGMVPPVYELQQSIAAGLNLNSELIILLIVFGVASLLIPVAVTLLAGALSRLLTNTSGKYSLREVVAAFAPSFVPIGLGIWIAHYTFHLLIGLWTIIPVFQEFIGMTGEWARFGGVSDAEIIGVIQLVGVVGGLLWSLMLAQRAAFRLFRREAAFGLLPWALFLLALAALAVWIFGLPMEMRGSLLFS
ncbi:MAG: FesM [Anaerolineaceae bacterium]|nr:FesM [Anaerolineaceae bacterium]